MLRFVTRHAGEGASPLRRVARVGSVASRLKREGHAIVETRCERGAGVVRQLELPEAAAVAVRELDEHWDGSGQPYGLSGDEISIVGRVGCVAQNAELFLAAGGQTAMRTMLGERRGRWFEPDARRRAARDRRERPDLARAQRTARPSGASRALAPDDIELGADDARLDQIAETFATIVDAKSPYTARHSHGVALHAGVDRRRARLQRSPSCATCAAAPCCTTSASSASRTRSSTSRASSTTHEFALIRSHPVFTEQILSRVPAFAPLAAAAAAHHERIDGRGYPYGLARQRADARTAACSRSPTCSRR